MGARLYLRALTPEDASDNYLGWLNDPEVQKFSRRRGQKTSIEQLKNFLHQASQSSDYHLAICLHESNKHIGNISLNSIDALNKSAEISIMMGDKTEWGKGYGREAIEIVSLFAFDQMKLHRLWAESPNPAFNQMIAHCGWIKEGTKKDAFFFDGRFIDLECWSLINHAQNS